MSTSTPALTFVTIGQAPRHDLAAALLERLPPDIEVSHRGVLDGLTADEVEERYGARPDDDPLVTKLADGTVVSLASSAVDRGLQDVVDAAEADGAGTIVILCTGEFPDLRTSSAWLVEPDAVVTAASAGLLSSRRVGILVPMPDQVAAAGRKWNSLNAPRFAAASPYGADSAVADAAQALVDAGAQALILDCMGYAPHHRDAIRAAGIAVPVLVSGSIVGAALGAAI
jgi:protein AroM